MPVKKMLFFLRKKLVATYSVRAHGHFRAFLWSGMRNISGRHILKDADDTRGKDCVLSCRLTFGPFLCRFDTTLLSFSCSVSGVVRVPSTSQPAVLATLVYLYTGQLVKPQLRASSLLDGETEVGVKPSPIGEGTGSRDSKEGKRSKQNLTPVGPRDAHAGPKTESVSKSRYSDSSLVVYVETADLAERWMLERLGLLCLEQVRRHLTPENAVAVLRAAAAMSAWAFAEAAVPILAPHYRELLNDEGFRELPEELQEAVSGTRPIS